MKAIAASLKHSLPINLLTVILLACAVYSTLDMRREAFPAIDFDTVSVRTVYPGASAESVELYVTTPLEEELQSVDGIEEMTSSSLEGLSMIVVKLDPDLSPRQKKRHHRRDPTRCRPRARSSRGSRRLTSRDEHQ